MNKEKLIYPGMKVAVMGLGVSGRAAVGYALLRGAQVSVSDLRSKEQLIKQETDILAGGKITVEAGGHTYNFLSKAELLIVSPGIDLNLPLFRKLKESGVNVVGELAFAAVELSVPCVAVTGTNGKTTVTTLVGEILKEAGKKVFVGGNIGTSLFDYLCKPDGIDCVVLEVSSFQLESAGNFAPQVAVLLNITPDHLDRHESMEGYTKAKMKIFEHQQREEIAILCADDSACKKMVQNIPAKVQMFGKDAGCAAQVMSKGSEVYINAEETYALQDTAFEGTIGGANSAAAILVAKALGCSQEIILKGLQKFSPLDHRMQYVADVAGVSYYNDSKATNTGAVISALEQFECKVVLIAGGRDKGDDYRLLRKSVAGRVSRMIVIGEAASLFATALSDVIDITYADTMKEAVTIAGEAAAQGEAVLLSPACASFDMFDSYGHRGREFMREVQALAEVSAVTMGRVQ